MTDSEENKWTNWATWLGIKVLLFSLYKSYQQTLFLSPSLDIIIQRRSSNGDLLFLEKVLGQIHKLLSVWKC